MVAVIPTRLKCLISDIGEISWSWIYGKRYSVIWKEDIDSSSCALVQWRQRSFLKGVTQVQSYCFALLRGCDVTAVWFILSIRSLSNDNADVNENGKTASLHVHHAFLYVSSPSLHDCDHVKCRISRIVENVNTKRRLCFSFLELFWSLLEFNYSIWQIERDGISAMNLLCYLFLLFTFWAVYFYVSLDLVAAPTGRILIKLVTQLL